MTITDQLIGVQAEGAQFGHMVEAGDGNGADVVVVQSQYFQPTESTKGPFLNATYMVLVQLPV